MTYISDQKGMFLKLWNAISSVPEKYSGDQARIQTALWFALPLGIVSHAGFFILF
jgi:hypothetical protein